MLEWICHLKPTYSPWEAPEDTSFTMTVTNKFVRESPPLKSPVIALLCRPDLAVGTAVTELENLNELGGIGS